MKRVKMNSLNENSRKNSFDEVMLGYSKEEAMLEASRCLNCKTKPCVKACPFNNDIPGFIEKIKNEEFNEAYKIIKKTSCFPGICSRVCPQEWQCEKPCTRGIKGESVAIGNLERFIYDNYKDLDTEVIVKNNKKVAVVGSGPSGLACANKLCELGYNVTIYEKNDYIGGVLRSGIPAFRLPRTVVDYEISNIINKGILINKSILVGKDISVEDIINEYNAIYIANGLSVSNNMNITGENLKGVYTANDFLESINLNNFNFLDELKMSKQKTIAVVGGGNVAMDVARTAKRLGFENVYIIYRRGFDELPASKVEIEDTLEEGIIFKTLVNPVEILGEYKVEEMKLIEMELGEPDESGRKSPFEKKNSEFIIQVDMVVMCLGTSPSNIISASTKNLLTNSKSYIVTDEEKKTSLDKVYAGGEIVTGASTVALSAADGIKAAISIDNLLKK